MKFKRILAFLPMMLAALWLPKTFLAWLDYGYVGAAQILDSDADMPELLVRLVYQFDSYGTGAWLVPAWNKEARNVADDHSGIGRSLE